MIVLVVGPPEPVRPDRSGVLPVPRAGPHDSRGTGHRGRNPLGHRGNVPNLERTDWAGSLPGPAIHRLVQTHDTLHAGARFPDRDPVKKGGRDPAGGDLIALSVPEIRRLLINLIWIEVPDPDHVLSRSEWRRRHQHRARQCHYNTRGHLP